MNTYVILTAVPAEYDAIMDPFDAEDDEEALRVFEGWVRDKPDEQAYHLTKLICSEEGL